MELAQFGGLFAVYLISLCFILTLTYKEFRRVKFNFNVLFSLLYLLTFYFGFPLTCLLVFQFDVHMVEVDSLLNALLSSTCFYAIYYVCYKTRLVKASATPRPALFTMNRVETNLTWMMLALVAIATVGIFFYKTASCCLSWKNIARSFPVTFLV